MQADTGCHAGGDAGRHGLSGRWRCRQTRVVMPMMNDVVVLGQEYGWEPVLAVLAEGVQRRRRAHKISDCSLTRNGELSLSCSFLNHTVCVRILTGEGSLSVT